MDINYYKKYIKYKSKYIKLRNSLIDGGGKPYEMIVYYISIVKDNKLFSQKDEDKYNKFKKSLKLNTIINCNTINSALIYNFTISKKNNKFTISINPPFSSLSKYGIKSLTNPHYIYQLNKIQIYLYDFLYRIYINKVINAREIETLVKDTEKTPQLIGAPTIDDKIQKLNNKELIKKFDRTGIIDINSYIKNKDETKRNIQQYLTQEIAEALQNRIDGINDIYPTIKKILVKGLIDIDRLNIDEELYNNVKDLYNIFKKFSIFKIDSFDSQSIETILDDYYQTSDPLYRKLSLEKTEKFGQNKCKVIDNDIITAGEIENISFN